MKKLKIALGDIRHKTVGRHSITMPVGVGYIASYTLFLIGKENIEVRLYNEADKLSKDIEEWVPDVIGLSNYCWNAELSRLVFKQAKKKNPRTVCISGGPDFPAEDSEREEYLLKRPEIDFYVYFDGEIAFAELISKVQKGDALDFLKSNSQAGVMAINPLTKKLVKGEILPRPANLDFIPSPYLTGLMDQWFDGYYAPCLETARGCPFTCAYCHTGNVKCKGLATFSLERVKDELTYIAERMKNYSNVLLLICDSNFAMYERDEEIANHCRALQDKFGWPNVFNVSTGKANFDRILKIAGILKNKIPVCCSVQSLNPKTLEIIGRRNVTMDEYRRIQSEIRKRGMFSMAEFIFPLPEETKESFFSGVKMVIDAGVKRIVPYTTMLLRGTSLASKESCKKYHLQSKFRIIPRQFGEYFNEKCFEIEETCIATNTVTMDDYLEVRGFSLILAFFSEEQFDVIRRHVKEMGISYYDFCLNLWQLIKSGETALTPVYREFLEETRAELWDSREEIYNFFSEPKNYAKLLEGELGDNLIRKYSLKLTVEHYCPALELIYDSIFKMVDAGDSEIADFLLAAKTFLSATRNLGIFKNYDYKNIDQTLTLKYDVAGWYDNDTRPLTEYKAKTAYRIFYDIKKFDKVFEQADKLYGQDFFYKLSKLVLFRGQKYFWPMVKKIV